MVLPELPAPMYFVGPPLAATDIFTEYFVPHPARSPPQEVDLRIRILLQIEYYFSAENLQQDTHLRMCMDPSGWVPVSVIAEFRLVKQLTSDLGFILESLHPSDVVQVEGDKIRRRENWSS